MLVLRPNFQRNSCSNLDLETVNEAPPRNLLTETEMESSSSSEKQQQQQPEFELHFKMEDVAGSHHRTSPHLQLDLQPTTSADAAVLDCLDHSGLNVSNSVQLETALLVANGATLSPEEIGGGEPSAPPHMPTLDLHESPASTSALSMVGRSSRQTSVPSGCNDHQQEINDHLQYDADKRSIYKHPLFPLLALLLEKCEMATQSIDWPNPEENLHSELQVFLQQYDADKPCLTEDHEVNDLMIRALQVLRIHLLELAKVQELCKDFCNRYISCLKTKMQSENLLRSDYGGGGYDSDDSANGCLGRGPPISLAAAEAAAAAQAAAQAVEHLHFHPHLL